MSKYNGEYRSDYAALLMGEFFRNSLRYFKGDVKDSEYFNPIVSMTDEQTVEQKVCDRFAADDLEKCGLVLFCDKEGRDPRNGRKYGNPAMFFSNDDPAETIQALWNDKGHNAACRKMLFEIVDKFISEHEKAADDDPLKSRFD